MSEQADDWVARVERAVWKELNRRRWFAHHVDGDEIEALEVDLKAGIAAALAAALASARADLERLQDDFMEQG